MAITILYVDDDQEDLEIFEEAINTISSSIKFLSARSAVDALELLGQQKELPNMIFVDINMPVMSGKEFLKTVKINRQLRNIPVVMYTTSRQQTEKDECKQLGAKDFITKPATFPILIEKLKNAIGY